MCLLHLIRVDKDADGHITEAEVKEVLYYYCCASHVLPLNSVGRAWHFYSSTTIFLFDSILACASYAFPSNLVGRA
jgi:hypothetical protein